MKYPYRIALKDLDSSIKQASGSSGLASCGPAAATKVVLNLLKMQSMLQMSGFKKKQNKTTNKPKTEVPLLLV